MIHSMTGFGGASFRAGDQSWLIEVRSVNHRHLDARVRLPRPMSALEAEVRGRIQERFARGKFDLSVVAAEGGAAGARLEVDLEAARQYLRAASALAGEGVPGRLGVSDLLALPGVSRFVEPQAPDEAARLATLAAVDAALGDLEAMRAAEGAAIERDLLARAERVAQIADLLEERADVVQQAVRERLRRRVQQLEAETGLLDRARLHQEVALAADRMDVTEELVRVRSHVDQFRKLVAEAAPGRAVGRRLDFLLQELAREANTIGAKGGDAPVAHLIVELKTEVERLREQVQNVE